MKTASLTILERSELPPAQARAILEVMEAELLTRDSALATKSDLQELEMKINVKFATLRGELRTDIAAIKGEMVRWFFAFWVAQLGAMVTLLKLLK